MVAGAHRRQPEGYLGRHVEFVLVPEDDENGRLHLHGEFQISVEEAEAARKAMRVALGEWPAEKDRPRGCPAWVPNMPRQHQVKTEPEPDHGHSCYITKDFWRSPDRLHIKLFAAMRVGFDCKPLSATKRLRARAEELYTHDRAMVIEARKVGKAKPTPPTPSSARPNTFKVAHHWLASTALHRVRMPIVLSGATRIAGALKLKTSLHQSPNISARSVGIYEGRLHTRRQRRQARPGRNAASAALRSWSAVKPPCEKFTIVAIIAQFARSTDDLRF